MNVRKKVVSSKVGCLCVCVCMFPLYKQSESKKKKKKKKNDSGWYWYACTYRGTCTIFYIDRLLPFMEVLL